MVCLMQTHCIRQCFFFFFFHMWLIWLQGNNTRTLLQRIHGPVEEDTLKVHLEQICLTWEKFRPQKAVRGPAVFSLLVGFLLYSCGSVHLIPSLLMSHAGQVKSCVLFRVCHLIAIVVVTFHCVQTDVQEKKVLTTPHPSHGIAISQFCNGDPPK
jgi:hypothetical protein